jgi:arsenate reductase-like glutaredoxin family protein
LRQTINITYTDRHIAEKRPTGEELKEWRPKSGLPLKKFFNTSGVLYKEMQLGEGAAIYRNHAFQAFLAIQNRY